MKFLEIWIIHIKQSLLFMAKATTCFRNHLNRYVMVIYYDIKSKSK